MSQARPWWIAARPHTLWAAVVPVLVGGGLAWEDGGSGAGRAFRADAFGAALIGAVAIQVAANFVNDIFDARKGADTEERIGPTRVVASGLLSERTVWIGTALVVAVAVAAGAYLIAIAGWVVAAIGITSLAAMLGYVGGPKPYGYFGLGEVFVFVFFGLVATVGARYVHNMTAPLDAWLLAIPIGFLVTAILVANNVRDIDTDRATGKNTLAVYLGRERTRALFAGLVWGAFVAILVFGVFDWTPRWTLLAMMAAPLTIPIVRTIHSQTQGPPLIRALKGVARLHLLVGVLLAIGAVLG
ncbi:MAG: 1,4-dihydroxy-2-naphthoate polyprenyltransferase [Acidimicrobiia bacterium]|nr:1,4-dihydroxy-2-naphthoate polyprenyltransferase [Acidimicrobiia bacterium]